MSAVPCDARGCRAIATQRRTTTISTGGYDGEITREMTTDLCDVHAQEHDAQEMARAVVEGRVPKPPSYAAMQGATRGEGSSVDHEWFRRNGTPFGDPFVGLPPILTPEELAANGSPEPLEARVRAILEKVAAEQAENLERSLRNPARRFHEITTPEWERVVFLGGTVGANEWRKERAIPFLRSAGLPPEAIFDPVVDDWTEAAQANEDRVKGSAAVLLFYIASPQTGGNDVSAYSLVEATMALYDDAERAVVVFDPAGMSPHVTRAIDKIERDLRQRFGEDVVFGSLDQALHEVATRLGA